MKRRVGIIVFLLLLLLAVSALLLLRSSPDVMLRPEPEPEPEPVVARVVEEGQSTYRIYASGNDRAAVAAAKHLARLLSERMGVELPVVKTINGEDGSCIVFRTDPAGEDGLPFEITLEEDADIVFSLRAMENNYGCARALAERWLSEDCGLQGDTLRLDQELIDTGFSGLSFEVEGMLRILSQNICYTDDPDGNSIAERAPRFFRLVEQYAPDVIGMQEVSEEWRLLLEEQYSDRYEIFGCSAYGYESTAGYGNYLLFLKDRFLFLNGGEFWLSETPEIEGTPAEPGCGARTGTWALLKDQKTGQVFYQVTTHPTAGSSADEKRVRGKQLRNLVAYMDTRYARYGEYPVLLVGDFNIIPSHDPELFLYLDELYINAATVALSNTSKVDYTYQSYGKRRFLLDYCFYRGENVVILNQHIADDMYDGYVSDHFGLVTDVFFD